MTEDVPPSPKRGISLPAAIVVSALAAITVSYIDDIGEQPSPAAAPYRPTVTAKPEIAPRKITIEDKRTLESECPSVTQGEIVKVVSPLKYPNSTSRIFSIASAIMNEEGNINSTVVNATNYMLSHASDRNKGDVLININSPGGHVDTGHALVDMVKYYGAEKVSLVCTGMAASEASIILSSGAKGNRYATLNCSFATHSVRTMMDNPDLKETIISRYSAEYLAAQREKTIAETTTYKTMYMAASGGKIDEKCASFLTRDRLTYLSSEQAMRLGFIDYVLADNGKALTLKAPTLSQ